MTRLIDADSVYKWYLEAFKGQIKPNEIRFSMNDIRDNLENIPTIDAVPIFRCKDCKHYVINELKKDGTEDRRYSPSVCIARLRAVEHGPDWYCADAEEKENDRQC